MWAPSAWFRVEADVIDMTDQPSMSEGKVYAYILQIIDQKTLFIMLAPLGTKTAREVCKHLYRLFAEHDVPQVLHTDSGGEFTGIVLLSELRRFFPSLCITTGTSCKPWDQGCVEQAHNALYVYLHHLRIYKGENFNWAELLPNVAYMPNTAVQTHKSESPMFQRDGCDNRLVNSNILQHMLSYRKMSIGNALIPSLASGPGQQDDTAMQICDGSDMHDSSTSNESDQPACGTHENANKQTPTRAYDARQKRAAWDNARAVQRNQKHMDQQTAADEVPFHEGGTVLICMPQRCTTKLDPANIVGRIRSVQVTSVERRYKIATPAGVLNRMHSSADLA
jgi:hypothetical protein